MVVSVIVTITTITFVVVFVAWLSHHEQEKVFEQ